MEPSDPVLVSWSRSRSPEWTGRTYWSGSPPAHRSREVPRQRRRRTESVAACTRPAAPGREDRPPPRGRTRPVGGRRSGRRSRTGIRRLRKGRVRRFPARPATRPARPRTPSHPAVALRRGPDRRRRPPPSPLSGRARSARRRPVPCPSARRRRSHSRPRPTHPWRRRAAGAGVVTTGARKRSERRLRDERHRGAAADGGDRGHSRQWNPIALQRFFDGVDQARKGLLDQPLQLGPGRPGSRS